MNSKTMTLLLVGMAAAIFLGYFYSMSGVGLRPASSEERAKNDVAAISIALQSYQAEYGRYPYGSSPDILNALQGNNPFKKQFIELAPKSLDRKGQLLDPWGIPYKISIPESNEQPKVWSSGKDRKDSFGSSNSDDISN